MVHAEQKGERKRSLGSAATEVEVRSPPSQEDNPIQGEVATMENGNIELLC